MDDVRRRRSCVWCAVRVLGKGVPCKPEQANRMSGRSCHPADARGPFGAPPSIIILENPRPVLFYFGVGADLRATLTLGVARLRTVPLGRRMRNEPTSS